MSFCVFGFVLDHYSLIARVEMYIDPMEGLERRVRKYVSNRPEALGFENAKRISVYTLPRTSHSHVNVVVRRLSHRIVIRVSTASRKNYTHLMAEYRVLKAVRKFGIAPKPVAIAGKTTQIGDPFLAVEYIEGEHLKRFGDRRIKELAVLMAKVHKTRIDSETQRKLRRVLSVSSALASSKGWIVAIRGYIHGTKERHRFVCMLYRAYRKVISDKAMFRSRRRLVHLDVAFENLLMSRGRIMLIDWERACISDPYYDIATAFERMHLTNRQRDLFLREYEKAFGAVSRAAVTQALNIRLTDRMIWSVWEAHRIRHGLKGPNFSKIADWKKYAMNGRQKFNLLKRAGVIPASAKWLDAGKW